MDWNRHTGRWSLLAASDDGRRFVETGLDAVHANMSDVTLAVSISYHVRMDGIREKFPSIQIVELTLDGADIDAHWSEEKQIALWAMSS